MLIGPQVAFVDDRKEQILPLERAVNDLHTGSIYFDASPDKNEYPKAPLETVEILFLDLIYGNKFRPENCAQWVETIIPENSKYSLVIWSKDTHEVEELMKILGQINRTPAIHHLWQKSDYNLAPEQFREAMQNLFSEVSYGNHIAQESFMGEVLEIQDETVLINCRISTEPSVFQVRRFDMDLLRNVENLKMCDYVMINTYTKPGARLIDIFELKKDLSGEFKAEDIFKGLEGGAFFKQD